MQLNLRKAHNLDNSISRAMGNINLDTSVEIDIHSENVDKVMSKSRSELIERIDLWRRLNAIRHDVRDLIGVANANSGIDRILCRSAKNKAEIGKIEAMIKNASVAMDSAIIARKLEAEKTRASEYSYRSNLAVELLSDEDLNVMRSSVVVMKRVQASLDDELLALNVKTTVDINEEDYQFLMDNGIV